MFCALLILYKEKICMLPAEFESRMKGLLKEEYSAFIDQYSKPPVRAIRLNSLYLSRFTPDFTVGELPYDNNAYYVGEDFPKKPGRSAPHHAGAYYVQEPSAMAPLACLDICEGMKILDVCASPGGKTVQAAMKNKSGVIVSNEIDKARARTLLGNIERMGIKNAIVTSVDSKVLADWFCGVFDIVICDAPCSGEGMMRKNPLAISEWSVNNVKMCAERQSGILDNAALTVAPGGSLIYSTCTFSLEENEMVVDRFLKTHPDFSLSDVPIPLINVTCDGISFEGCLSDIHKCRRFYPHIAPGEGQFFALMKREKSLCEASSPRYRSALSSLDRTEEKIAREFLNAAADLSELTLSKHANEIVISPDFPVPPFGVFAPGVRVGLISKGRLIPHHQLFSAYGELFKNKLELTKTMAQKYLFGETLNADLPDSWGVATIDGIPLGGFKAVSGRLNNHYPKGLRNHL